MTIRFRLLTEADVKAVLTMDDLIETMASALERFSSAQVVQPVRPTIPIAADAFFATMPAYVRSASLSGERQDGPGAALGAKLVTVFAGNTARGLHTHLATIVLLDPDTGALLALLDGRYITEARTAAVSAVSSRLLARANASSLAIIGSGVQARSHLAALSRVHQLKQVTVWSPQKLHRDRFVEQARTAMGTDRGQIGDRPRSVPSIAAVDHAGEAVVGADIIVIASSSTTPVLENGWIKPGAHVISVGATRPNHREMDPALVARGRLFVDSREAALVEAGDIVMGIEDGLFTADHIAGEIGQLLGARRVAGRTSDTQITIFKSLGMAVEDVTAADLAYRRAVKRGIGQELTL